MTASWPSSLTAPSEPRTMALYHADEWTAGPTTLRLLLLVLHSLVAGRTVAGAFADEYFGGPGHKNFGRDSSRFK